MNNLQWFYTFSRVDLCCRMMLATWMARCGINARIVDKRGTKIYAGQADGLQLRSLEIFDSFGFADRAWKEANHLIEVCYNPMGSIE